MLTSWKPVIADGLEPPRIGVLYPAVKHQYSHMFEEYIKGISSVPNYRVSTLMVDQHTRTESVRQWTEKHQIDGFIALGQMAYRHIHALNSRRPLVAGAMVATPPGISGISMTGDPEAFLRRLQVLNPAINRVYFIYSKANNGWLISRARGIGKQYGIEFIPLKVDSLKQASLQYRIVLNSVQASSDAIWIPLDNIAPLDLLLPEILRNAWNNDITVFSNNLQHVRRGALFSLYPDSYRQGRRLVALLQRHLDSPSAPAILYPSVNLKIAVNLRTANHLQLRYNQKMIKTFDSIFPGFH